MSVQSAGPREDLDDDPIRFRIRFSATEQGSAELLRMLEDEYLPALGEQPGFLTGRVLTPFSPALSAEIQGVTNSGEYELEFDFRSEAHRRAWVAQPIHDRLWERAVELSTAQQWGGFFIVAGTGTSRTAGEE